MWPFVFLSNSSLGGISHLAMNDRHEVIWDGSEELYGWKYNSPKKDNWTDEEKQSDICVIMESEKYKTRKNICRINCFYRGSETKVEVVNEKAIFFSIWVPILPFIQAPKIKWSDLQTRVKKRSLYLTWRSKKWKNRNHNGKVEVLRPRWHRVPSTRGCRCYSFLVRADFRAPMRERLGVEKRLYSLGSQSISQCWSRTNSCSKSAESK